MAEDNTYTFERRRFGQYTGLRSRDRAAQELPKFARRLGFSKAVPWTAYENRLLDLVENLHLNIEWYENKIRKELVLYWFYVGASLLLLLVLPLVLLWLNADQSHPAASTAAAVAGLIAFHRGLSSWLSQRRVLARRAKASSALKELLYSFEHRWDRTFFDSWTADAFERDIQDCIDKARAIVRAETETYYAELTYPGFDVGSLLGEAGKQAKDLVATFRAPEQPAAPPAPADTDAAMRERELQRLRAEVAQLEAELETARQGPAEEQAQRRLALEDAVRRMRATMVDLAS